MKRACDRGRAVVLFAASMLLVSCANPGVPLPPSLELPRRVSDLHASRKGNKVTLSWTVPGETVDHQSIRHSGPINICRTFDPSRIDCAAPLAELSASAFPVPAKPKKGESAAKVQDSYIDIVPGSLQSQHPADLLSYAVCMLNPSGRSAGPSNTVQVPAAPTLPPPMDFGAEVTADGVTLHWANAPLPNVADLQFLVRIYRRMEDSKADAVAGEVPVSGDKSEWLDQSFEWEKNYQYRAEIVTIIRRQGAPDLQVEGDDTPTVKVFAHDVFPPKVPSGLQAVASGAGQKPFIDLIWAPVSDGDLAGYNVYRREEGTSPVKINSDLAKAPAYRDADVASGHVYTYSVTAVDLRGNESAHSDEASEKIP